MSESEDHYLSKGKKTTAFWITTSFICWNDVRCRWRYFLHHACIFLWRFFPVEGRAGAPKPLAAAETETFLLLYFPGRLLRHVRSSDWGCLGLPSEWSVGNDDSNIATAVKVKIVPCQWAKFVSLPRTAFFCLFVLF